MLVQRGAAPRKLEKQRIYRVRYNPFKERDVQDVWIADMFIAGDTLWIRDELNRIYSMTMKTFSVTQRKDVSIDDLQKLKRKTAANVSDAGNGSEAVCRVFRVQPSPSPDPRRSANQN